MKLFKTGCGCLGLVLIAIPVIVVAGYYLKDGFPTSVDDAFDKAEGLVEGATDLMRSATGRLKDLSSDGEELAPPFEPDPNSYEEGKAVEVYFGPCAEMSPWWGIDDQLVGLLKNARESIHCAFYDLQLRLVADVLIEQHEKGVDVAIVSDSEYADREAVRACIAAGIPVEWDERDPFMHNKFCVVDGRYVWTGSTNVTENGMYKNNNNAVRIASKELAVNYSREFQEMFKSRKFGRRSPSDTAYPEVVVDGIVIECYFAPEDGVRKQIIREIDEAEQSIDFMAFSFTSPDIAIAMASRAERGVVVRGLFEKRCAGSKYSKDEFLAERDCTVYLDANSYTMHHKVVIIDGETVVTGSYNFSKQAETNNDENVLIIHSKEIGEQFTEEFEKLIKK